MSDPTARLASQLLDLRLPLTRMALASSQLHREPLTPTSESHCRTLSEAVQELDERIEAVLRSIAPPVQDELVPASTVVDTLVERARPLLHARGLALEVGDTSGSLPRSAAHRAGLALLRAAAQAAPAGATVALSADASRLRAVAPCGEAATSTELAQTLEALGRAVAELGAELTASEGTEAFDSTILLEGPWNAV